MPLFIVWSQTMEYLLRKSSPTIFSEFLNFQAESTILKSAIIFLGKDGNIVAAILTLPTDPASLAVVNEFWNAFGEWRMIRRRKGQKNDEVPHDGAWAPQGNKACASGDYKDKDLEKLVARVIKAARALYKLAEPLLCLAIPEWCQKQEETITHVKEVFIFIFIS